MNILGIYYTNNKIKREVLLASISSVEQAANYTNLKQQNRVALALNSWEVIPEWKGKAYKSHYKGNGHLNIIAQILQVMYHNERGFDLVCLLEHDVLYAPNYFEKILAAHIPGSSVITCNRDYIGMSKDGYVYQDTEKWGWQACLSQFTFTYNAALYHFNSKLKDCFKQSWCYLEPGYGETDPQSLRFINYLPFEGKTPNVHVNMNDTSENHHFTGHFQTYLKEPFAVEHPLWGNYKKFNFYNPQ